jgi:hypothetical protein
MSTSVFFAWVAFGREIDYGADTLWDQRQCVNAAFLHSTKHTLE